MDRVERKLQCAEHVGGNFRGAEHGRCSDSDGNERGGRDEERFGDDWRDRPYRSVDVSQRFVARWREFAGICADDSERRDGDVWETFFVRDGRGDLCAAFVGGEFEHSGRDAQRDFCGDHARHGLRVRRGHESLRDVLEQIAARKRRDVCLELGCGHGRHPAGRWNYRDAGDRCGVEYALRGQQEQDERNELHAGDFVFSAAARVELDRRQREIWRAGEYYVGDQRTGYGRRIFRRERGVQYAAGEPAAGAGAFERRGVCGVGFARRQRAVPRMGDRIQRVDAAIVGTFNANPNGSDSGIWMGGGAPAADSSGNLYFLDGQRDL